MILVELVLLCRLARRHDPCRGLVPDLVRAGEAAGGRVSCGEDGGLRDEALSRPTETDGRAETRESDARRVAHLRAHAEILLSPL